VLFSMPAIKLKLTFLSLPPSLPPTFSQIRIDMSEMMEAHSLVRTRKGGTEGRKGGREGGMCMHIREEMDERFSFTHFLSPSLSYIIV